MTQTPQHLTSHTHAEMLSILARAKSEPLKALAERLLDMIGDIEVLENRTGLTMLPMADTAQGTNFHLGEVLMSEARILSAGQEGYAMRRGRDLEAAMAMAIVDLSVALGLGHDACSAFLSEEAAYQADEDRETLRRVEATRVDMETF